ncbi:MAG: T9SS type A sorting domain-containing protein [Bacteroidetes bacterium]|nr:T9SS type A sorting domain-containing protein [Bacteroidota bacterium]
MKKYLVLSFLFLLAFVFICAGIDLWQPENYAAQSVPSYITLDNTPQNNLTTDKGASLGRVLFYDKQLSLDGSQACASCHHQEFAFSDTAQLSDGYKGGKTVRHAMRLVNNRFSNEIHYFWNERAATLEEQTTMPIQDHVEMGFSGSQGDPGIDSLIKRMYSLSYYPKLFKEVFGDTLITESRMQFAMGQFVRSIQSFDTKFDEGLAQAGNLNNDFPNYTGLENTGKRLFLAPPPTGGAGCQGCHKAPEFDIDPNTHNNGVIHVAGSVDDIDLDNTKAPSLRDLFNANGQLNGPLMHNGEFLTLMDVINHYDSIPNDPRNTNLDNRLRGPGGNGTQQLGLTNAQKQALVAFIKTLSGSDVYTNPKWSDPFNSDGSLTLSGLDGFEPLAQAVLQLYPNPSRGNFLIECDQALNKLEIFDQSGRHIITFDCHNSYRKELSLQAPAGIYYVTILLSNGTKQTKKLVLSQ